MKHRFAALRLTSAGTIVGALLTLQGCVTPPVPTTVAASGTDSLEIAVQSDLDTLAEGDSVSFYSDNGVLSPLGQVRIGREYLAASGRLCKRILSSDGEELLSVICKASDERWYMRKLS